MPVRKKRRFHTTLPPRSADRASLQPDAALRRKTPNRFRFRFSRTKTGPPHRIAPFFFDYAHQENQRRKIF